MQSEDFSPFSNNIAQIQCNLQYLHSMLALSPLVLLFLLSQIKLPQIHSPFGQQLVWGDKTCFKSIL